MHLFKKQPVIFKTSTVCMIVIMLLPWGVIEPKHIKQGIVTHPLVHWNYYNEGLIAYFKCLQQQRIFASTMIAFYYELLLIYSWFAELPKLGNTYSFIGGHKSVHR